MPLQEQQEASVLPQAEGDLQEESQFLAASQDLFTMTQDEPLNSQLIQAQNIESQPQWTVVDGLQFSIPPVIRDVLTDSGNSMAAQQLLNSCPESSMIIPEVESLSRQTVQNTPMVSLSSDIEIRNYDNCGNAIVSTSVRNQTFITGNQSPLYCNNFLILQKPITVPIKTNTVLHMSAEEHKSNEAEMETNNLASPSNCEKSEEEKEKANGMRLALNARKRRERQRNLKDETFKCSKCGKCFQQADHLKSHTLTHTGVKPHK